MQKGHENKENYQQQKKLLMKHKFSLSAPKGLYAEQYGEYLYWC